MRLRFALLLLAVIGGRGFIPPAAAADPAEYGGLPTGAGQEEVFVYCAACHSIHLVTQQRLSRADWADALVWMVKEQGMPKLDPADRKLVLDYLGKYYGRDVPR